MDKVVIESWGSFPWEQAELGVQIGTLEVALTKAHQDISTHFSYSNDVYWQNPDSWLNEWRTIVKGEQPFIELVPTCPNRNVVARPIRELFVPAKSEVTIYVGYPSWVQIKTAADIVLADLATELMSDTWLGPNTRNGEVAYATPTQARLERRNLPDQTHIIRTPVIIENDSEEKLQISRISIPVPELSTYLSNGRLWTQAVTIHCDANLSEATIEIGERPPEYIESSSAISPPRRLESSSSMSRAIGFLLG